MTLILSYKMLKRKSGDELVIHQDIHGSLKIVFCEEEFTFAHSLRNAARLMRNNAAELPSEESYGLMRSGYIYGAIVLAYSALEAALNEVIHLRALVESSPLSESQKSAVFDLVKIDHEDAEYEREHVLLKFNRVLRILGKPPLAKNQVIYQNADLARRLRNLIVHPIPGRVVTCVDSQNYDYALQQKITRKLRSALKLGTTATFPKDVITCQCADWAVQSCENFLSAFLDATSINIGFMTGRGNRK